MSLIGKSVGNYRVVAKVGEGGMGSVYLGEHPLIGKRVAIKVLHEDLATKEDIVSRFFTEAKAVNDIGHPNIVDIVDFGKMPGDVPGKEIVYFVMEFLDGEGLNSRLKREGISMHEGVHVITQCASALQASHKKNIVHRDLKPENIFLIHRGQDRSYVKLLDFGIAKLTGGDNQISKHQTRTGLVIGTPAYMSPEQCEGKGNIDWRSDIYSLGIVLYEMLTGKPPFGGDGFGEILVAHLTKAVPPPSSIREDVPADIESVVMHALEKDRNRRFQSMDEFAAALANPAAHLEAYGATTVRSAPKGTMVLDDAPRPMTGAHARIPTGQHPRPTTVGEPQRPTTLSGAASEVAGDYPPPPAPPRPAGRGLLFGLGGAVIAAGGLAAYFLVFAHKETPKPVIPVVQTQQEKPPAPKDEWTHIAVDSTPRGAKAYRAGIADPVGMTPFELKVKRGEPEFDLLLKLDGYTDQTKTVSTDRDHDMLIALEKPAAPPTAPPPVEKPEAKKDGHHSAAASHHKEGKDLFKPVSDKPKTKDRDGVLAPEF